MKDDLIEVDPALLVKWNRPVPRYTSYPTAPQFAPIEERIYREKIALFDTSEKPLSIYIHIPFCKTMCLYCACSVVLNRKPERQRLYVERLLEEIKRVGALFSRPRKVSQLHLGGGTPTALTEEEFSLLMDQIRTSFFLLDEGEISIEVDPRTVAADRGKKLLFLKQIGFNRISFGVQDLDPLVQEAVRRRQSEEMTLFVYEKGREFGFEGINIDLIYGLPYQTVERFSKTAEKLIELKPDRIALYSYAKVPWLKPHQKAIPEETLPSTQEKWRIYVDARARFMKGGYTAIGMDHFALANDPIAKAYCNRTLTRNFQGYSVELAEDMIGFGLTSIGFLENNYFQNEKELGAYQKALQEGKLPIARGYLLSPEDRERRAIIQSWMCHFEVEKKKLPPIPIETLKKDGLLIETADKLIATPLGRLLIRLIASAYDPYFKQGQFSRAI